MVSNRESARRSRKRKAEQLSDLEGRLKEAHVSGAPSSCLHPCACACLRLAPLWGCLFHRLGAALGSQTRLAGWPHGCDCERCTAPPPPTHPAPSAQKRAFFPAVCVQGELAAANARAARLAEELAARDAEVALLRRQLGSADAAAVPVPAPAGRQ